METILSVAIITALFSGAAALLKVLFTKNANKELEYQHTERMITLLSQQTNSSEKLLNAVEGLREDVSDLRTEFKGLNERVLRLEERELKS